MIFRQATENLLHACLLLQLHLTPHLYKKCQGSVTLFNLKTRPPKVPRILHLTSSREKLSRAEQGGKESPALTHQINEAFPAGHTSVRRHTPETSVSVSTEFTSDSNHICHHFRLASLSRIWRATEAKSMASLAISSALLFRLLSFSPLSSSFILFSEAMAPADSALQSIQRPSISRDEVLIESVRLQIRSSNELHRDGGDKFCLNWDA